MNKKWDTLENLGTPLKFTLKVNVNFKGVPKFSYGYINSSENRFIKQRMKSKKYKYITKT